MFDILRTSGSSVLKILAIVAVAAPVAVPVAAAGERVERLVVAVGPPSRETNRIWMGGWVNFTQYEPILETLIDNDPNTGEFAPRLAERWETSEDFREWTFHIRRGVPFHFGYGELTAHDVLHTYQLLSREDTEVNMASVWRNQVAEVEVIDDYTISFRFQDPYIDGERLFSRTGGELYVTSKAQWDAEGMAGMDARLAGTGAYRFKERRLGEALVVEAVEDHWRDEPQFPEIEMRWVPDDTTRLAMLLAGEAHAAVMSRDVAEQATSQGMKVISSKRENMQQFVAFGGLYFNSGEPQVDPDNPLLNPLVRQALAKAVDLQELHEVIWKGRVSPLYRYGWHPDHEGWNDQWVERFDEMYGFDPDRAVELLAEAGYGPGEIQLRILSYELTGQPEIAQITEALQLYWAAIGVEASLEQIDFGTFLSRWDAADLHRNVYVVRNTPLRTTQEFIFFWHTAGARGKNYLDDFLEEAFVKLRGTLDPAQRDRIAREVGDYLYDRFDTIPLGATHGEVVVNPAVIADWHWPGQAPTGLTHYYMIERAE